MPSAEFRSFPLSDIVVLRESRSRREISSAAIMDMADSLARIGLINPIVIQRDGTLIAGETRYLAAKHLGWTHLSVQFADELDPRELLSIEIEENVKRTDLPWQDRVAAVQHYHELQIELDPTWTQEATGKALGFKLQTVKEYLGVARAIASGNERVAEAPRYSIARGIVTRENSRARADQVDLIPEMETEERVLNVDFHQWIASYAGAPFNLLHCDFPYGIDAGAFNQGAGSSLGHYADTPETYFGLLDCLISNRERLLGDSGHVLFWFSMKWYQATLDKLAKAFWVDPYPMVWFKNDNRGTLPWPDKSARRVYEVAFLCSHGDRKIIRSVSNVFAAPLGEREHMSEKNETMLKHFLGMFVDKNTRMLDPTCGSGSALRAAEALGAKKVLGLEINGEYANNARRALRRL